MKLQCQSVIRFCTKERNGLKAIHYQMLAVYDDAEPSKHQMKYWSKEFKQGRESSEMIPALTGQWKWLLWKCAKKFKTWSCRTVFEDTDNCTRMQCIRTISFSHLPWSPGHVEGQFSPGSENASSTSEAVQG